jgi:phosphate transport system permease protein
MSTSALLFVLLALALVGFRLGKTRSLALAGGGRQASQLHSRPHYYGLLTALWCAIPALIVIGVWLPVQSKLVRNLVVQDLPASVQALPASEIGLFMNDVHNVASGNVAASLARPEVVAAAKHYNQLQTIGRSALAVIAIVCAMLAIIWVRSRLTARTRARNQVENIVKVLLVVSSTIAIFTTVGIVLSVLYESLQFFRAVPWWEFLIGTQWSPQMALRADQVGASGAFGAVPLFAGTLLISGIAMIVAVPIGLFAAIYLAEYADKRLRAVIKPLLEVLAGIPTVVYGFFAALTVGPYLRHFGESIGLAVSSESALAAGLVMGIMIIPFISSLSEDMISAVPHALREGSYGLGATRSETIRKVVLPAALPGIVGGVLLAISRAIGETMIVVMAAGMSANLTANPLAAVTTVTVQIVTLLVGDQEFDSPKTLAAFALGLILFVVTLLLNVIALRIVRKYREQYE